MRPVSTAAPRSRGWFHRRRPAGSARSAPWRARILWEGLRPAGWHRPDAGWGDLRAWFGSSVALSRYLGLALLPGQPGMRSPYCRFPEGRAGSHLGIVQVAVGGATPATRIAATGFPVMAAICN